MTLRPVTDALPEAWHSLASHRLRSGLATVGVVAGVATIVAALAVAAGSRKQAIAEIGALGTDTIIVRAVPPPPDPTRRVKRAPDLTLSDAAALSRLRGARVAALKSVTDTAVVGDRSVPATTAGVSYTWRSTAGLSIARGRWLDDDATSRTAVLAQPLADALFGREDPIGRSVLAAGEWRVIIGVLPAGAARLGLAAPAVDPDRTLFVPIGSLDVSLGLGDTGDAVEQLTVKQDGDVDLPTRAEDVRAILANRRDGASDAFEVIVPRALLEARLRADRGAQWLVLAIGALVLLVSGAGIMNILTAAVIERTAEIGVRRACGARRSEIRIQFAAEAALLTAAGGTIGLPIGAAVAASIAWLAGWPVAVTAFSLILAWGSAVGVGLSAGIYPAHVAASLTPTQALHQ